VSGRAQHASVTLPTRAEGDKSGRRPRRRL